MVSIQVAHKILHVSLATKMSYHPKRREWRNLMAHKVATKQPRDSQSITARRQGSSSSDRGRVAGVLEVRGVELIAEMGKICRPRMTGIHLSAILFAPLRGSVVLHGLYMSIYHCEGSSSAIAFSVAVSKVLDSCQSDLPDKSWIFASVS